MALLDRSAFWGGNYYFHSSLDVTARLFHFQDISLGTKYRNTWENSLSALHGPITQLLQVTGPHPSKLGAMLSHMLTHCKVSSTFLGKIEADISY